MNARSLILHDDLPCRDYRNMPRRQLDEYLARYSNMQAAAGDDDAAWHQASREIARIGDALAERRAG